MSIQSEIKRIKDNIINAFKECGNKNATIPTIQNSDNLSNCIKSILVPNGNILITENGDFDVTQYAIANVNVENASGLVIPLEISPDGVLRKKSDILEWNSGEATSIGPNALSYEFAFGNETNVIIKSLSFPHVKTIFEEGLDGFYSSMNSLYTTTNLENINFPELEHIRYGGLRASFQNSKIKNIIFPKLLDIGRYGMANCFTRGKQLETADFPLLNKIGEEYEDGAMSYTFSDSSIKKISFPKLSTIDGRGNFTSMLSACSNTHLYFNALDETSFLDSDYADNNFKYMLQNAKNCVVHFQADTKNFFATLPSVMNGMGGTNTTILFDLNPTTIQFDVKGSNNYEIWVDEEKVMNNEYKSNSYNKVCTIVDLDKNNVYIKNITGLIPKTQNIISIDMNQPYNKVALTSNINGINANFNINGKILPAKVETPYYYINLYGDNIDLSYNVNGSNIKTEAGNIAYTGTPINLELNLIQGSWVDYVRPNLTSNGTFGVDEFACKASINNDYVYTVFDNDKLHSSWVNMVYPNDNVTLSFYINSGVLMNSINIEGYSTVKCYPLTIKLLASVDDIEYEELGTFKSDYYPIYKMELPNNSKFYKYYTLEFSNFKKQGWDVYFGIANITPVGRIFQPSA